MKQGWFDIVDNLPLTEMVWQMRLRGDTSAIERPGQFVNIRRDGLFLRRPLSVCDCEGDILTLVYKVVGRGTRQLSEMTGGTLDVLTGLGNGYDVSASGDRPLLLGGGVGVPPLYWLARELTGAGRQVSVVLGFNTAAEVFYEQEFRALGAAVTVTTVDGSYGTRGFVTDVLSGRDDTYCYVCGPEPMLHAVHTAVNTDGEFSFEERMGCGFGACMGCSCHTITGNKRICKEGPVLRKGEILWGN